MTVRILRAGVDRHNFRSLLVAVGRAWISKILVSIPVTLSGGGWLEEQVLYPSKPFHLSHHG